MVGPGPRLIVTPPPPIVPLPVSLYSMCSNALSNRIFRPRAHTNWIRGASESSRTKYSRAWLFLSISLVSAWSGKAGEHVNNEITVQDVAPMQLIWISSKDEERKQGRTKGGEGVAGEVREREGLVAV